jgi:hypothetical protein
MKSFIALTLLSASTVSMAGLVENFNSKLYNKTQTCFIEVIQSKDEEPKAKSVLVFFDEVENEKDEKVKQNLVFRIEPEEAEVQAEPAEPGDPNDPDKPGKPGKPGKPKKPSVMQAGTWKLEENKVVSTIDKTRIFTPEGQKDISKDPEEVVLNFDEKESTYELVGTKGELVETTCEEIKTSTSEEKK